MKYISPEGPVINTNSGLTCAQFFTGEVISLFELLVRKVIKVDIFKLAKENEDMLKVNFLMFGILSDLEIIPSAPYNIIKAVEEASDQNEIKGHIKALELGRPSSAGYRI